MPFRLPSNFAAPKPKKIPVRNATGKGMTLRDAEAQAELLDNLAERKPKNKKGKGWLY